MTIRTADGSQYPALLAAIGAVTHSSAGLAQMFQQVAATVTGSWLVVFAFDDKTLMPQRDLLEKFVLATNWNEYAPHPEIRETDRQVLLDVLSECRQLIEFRNRIAHDTWDVWPSEEVLDRVVGRRPVRWSGTEVETSIGSINVVAKHIGFAAGALSSLESRVDRSRNGDTRVEEDRRPEQFLQLCDERKKGSGFLWQSTKWEGRPQRVNRSPLDDESDTE